MRPKSLSHNGAIKYGYAQPLPWHSGTPDLFLQTPGVIDGNGNLLLRHQVPLDGLDRGVAEQELGIAQRLEKVELATGASRLPGGGCCASLQTQGFRGFLDFESRLPNSK